MKDELEDHGPAGLGQYASMTFLAGATTGIGAIAGIAIGAGDQFRGSIMVLGIIGMLVLSVPFIWVVSSSWRRRYIATLPFFWLLIAGSLIARQVIGQDSEVANIIVLMVAIILGKIASNFILKQTSNPDYSSAAVR